MKRIGDEKVLDYISTKRGRVFKIPTFADHIDSGTALKLKSCVKINLGNPHKKRLSPDYFKEIEKKGYIKTHVEVVPKMIRTTKNGTEIKTETIVSNRLLRPYEVKAIEGAVRWYYLHKDTHSTRIFFVK